MKCPRCTNEMRRTKLREHQYMYVCPKCRFKIGTRKEEQETNIVDTTREDEE